MLVLSFRYYYKLIFEKNKYPFGIFGIFYIFLPNRDVNGRIITEIRINKVWIK